MSYDLNIVRKNDWSNDEEESNISIEEWITYALQDKELLRNEESGEFEWVAYPHIEESGIPWFNYSNGYIYTKNPDLFVIKKMIAIAELLNAKVQGEEGEIYDDSFLEEYT